MSIYTLYISSQCIDMNEILTFVEINNTFNTKKYQLSNNLYNITNKRLKALKLTKAAIIWFNLVKPLKSLSMDIDTCKSSDTQQINISITEAKCNDNEESKKDSTNTNSNVPYGYKILDENVDKTSKVIASNNESVKVVSLKRPQSNQSISNALKKPSNIVNTVEDNELEFVNISTPVARLYAGQGVIHTKLVDVDASIFFYEHKKCEIRKQILRNELKKIQSELNKLQNNSLDRERQKDKAITLSKIK